MICTYLRSSSYNGYKFCPHQYFLEYVLGLESITGKKAVQGTIVHKALEILAVEQVARQTNQDFYTEDVAGKRKIDELSSAEIISMAWEHYTSKYNYHKWAPREEKECIKWFNMALTYMDGMFNPKNINILHPEFFFDITLNQNWAYYEYDLPNGERIEGQLSLKGTVDLITKVNDDTLEVIDWKTGRRLDWATGKEKTYEALCNDPQLRLYHLALVKSFPQYKHIMLTIYFIKDGGPFTITFSRDDIPETESLIRKRYLAIKGDQLPYQRRGWHCSKICHFGKNSFSGESQTICESVHDDLVNIGMNNTVSKHMGDSYNFVYANPGE